MGELGPPVGKHWLEAQLNEPIMNEWNGLICSQVGSLHIMSEVAFVYIGKNNSFRVALKPLSCCF